MHDENGNVDPTRAAEPPVPRGSTATKRRSTGEEGSPLQVKKPKSPSESLPPLCSQGGTAGVLMPQTVPRAPAQQPPTKPQSRPPPPVINEPPPEPRQPEIDPSLFSVYPEPSGQGPYAHQSYPYPTTEHAQNQGYEYPSLEQIANEVLDMNGRGQEDYIDAQLNALPYQRHNPHEHVHVYHAHDTAPMPDGLPSGMRKPDESVDSAISLPNSDTIEQTRAVDERTRSVDERLMDAFAANNGIYHGLPPVQPSVEPNGPAVNGESVSQLPVPQHSVQDDANALPLYRPPAPLSQSPEQTKRQPVTALANGFSDLIVLKRKAPDSASVSPDVKRAKTGEHETEDERLAKEMHQEEIGLRRRGSK